MTAPEDDGHYLLEFLKIGKSVKVTAFDPVTLKEVSIVGSAHSSRQQLGQLAVRKLEYMMNKTKDK